MPDGFEDKPEGDRHGVGRDQETIIYRLVEAVSVRRHTPLQVKEPIRVTVDFILGGGGKTYQKAVEIIEDRAVFPVDRAVRLVDHDKIEMPDAEPALTLRSLIDQPHHGRIS